MQDKFDCFGISSITRNSLPIEYMNVLMAIYTLTLNFPSLSNLTYTWKDMFRKKKKLIFREIEEKSKNVTILKLKICIDSSAFGT